MKYIIWGVGNRGKRAFKLIGSENVIAFIDGNPSLIGGKYERKPIISKEEAFRMYDDVIYIITPEKSSDMIEAELESRGIFHYLRFDDCPMGITYAYEQRGVFELFPIRLNCSKCGLYGINLFSLLLYDYLQENCSIQVSLIAQKGLSEQLIRLVEKEYRLLEYSNIQQNIEQLIVLEDERKVLACNYEDISVIGIEDLMEKYFYFQNDRIKEFHDIHKGKRCFIIATGPSLRVEDLNRLKEHGEICFSMNRIYNIFDRTDWRPDYYMIQDYEMIEDIADEVAALDLPYKFVTSLPESYWRQIMLPLTIKYYSIIEDIRSCAPRFSKDVSKCAYDGKTVTYACLQMAVYMGFEEIYLLGVDFNYSEDIHSEGNHFPGYHVKDKQIRLYPFSKERVLSAYESAKEFADSHDIRIYNATRGGKLEVFERVDFDKLFN